MTGKAKALPSAPDGLVGKMLPDQVAATESGLADAGGYGENWEGIRAAGAGHPGVPPYFGAADPVSGDQAYVGVFDDQAGAAGIDADRARVVDGELVHLFSKGIQPWPGA